MLQSTQNSDYDNKMKVIQREAIVPFSSKKMFDLVDNIADYPKFLPHCSASEEISRNKSGVLATLSVTKGSFVKEFTTQNTNYPNEKIVMALVDGPFKSLSGIWSFTELNATACKISLKVEFEFSNILTSMAFSKVFSQMAESFVDAFSQRAKEVYSS